MKEIIDQDLDYTRSLRLKIIEDLTQEKLPSDKDDRAFLLAAIDGIDRAALNRAKLKTEESSVKLQEQTAGIIANVLNKINKNSLHQGTKTNRILDVEYDGLTIVEGETDIGLHSLSFDEFFKDS